MKLCKDCAHHIGFGLCKSPENGNSLIDGKPNAAFCSERRSYGDPIIFIGCRKCGVDAKNFTAIINKKPWWKFYGG